MLLVSQVCVKRNVCILGRPCSWCLAPISTRMTASTCSTIAQERNALKTTFVPWEPFRNNDNNNDNNNNNNKPQQQQQQQQQKTTKNNKKQQKTTKNNKKQQQQQQQQPQQQQQQGQGEAGETVGRFFSHHFKQSQRIHGTSWDCYYIWLELTANVNIPSIAVSGSLKRW